MSKEKEGLHAGFLMLAGAAGLAAFIYMNRKKLPAPQPPVAGNPPPPPPKQA